MSLSRLFAVLCALALFFGLPAAFAQDADTFADPEERFTVPIPTNWTAETIDGYALLQDPDQAISIYIVVVESEDAAAAIESAWETVQPGFDLDVQQSISPPPAPGEDEQVVNSYETAADRLTQALARRVGGTTFVVLIDGDLNAVIQRNAQAQQILTGLTLQSVEALDLSGAEALPVADISGELEAYAAELLTRLEVPGAAIAIVEDGEVVYSAAFGVKSLDGDDPITSETQFLIGSTTKPMTTTMMAALVDQGVFDWDTPVVDVLPQFAVADPALTERFTIRNLVCACTGVPRRDFELIFNGSDLSADDIVASLATFEFFTDFGEAFQYSNQLVATGGYAAAAAYAPGEDLRAAYLDAMQTLIFDPVGMENTTFNFDQVVERGDYATPHGAALDALYHPLTLETEQALLEPIDPAGGAWSTVGDMALYMETMLERGLAPGGERVVSEENLLVTWQPQVAIDADTQYGLGWFVRSVDGIPVIGHDGNTLGMTSLFQFLPEQNVGIVVLSNAQAANLYNQGVASRMIELLYGQPARNDQTIQFTLDQAEAAMAELEAGIGGAPSEADVADLLGEYQNEVLGSVTVRYEDGRLLLDAGEFVSELRPSLTSEAEGDAFITYDAPLAGVSVVFIGTGGDVQLVIGENVTQYRFTR